MKYLLAGLWALALALMVQVSAPAQAWTHGTGAAPPVGPVLQNVAVSFGNRTPSGRGSVRLSSQDLNYSTGFNPYGLDMLVGGSCAKYSTSRVSGTVGHLNYISHVAEGTSAITPTPTSAGATAQLNGGPYVTQVACEDASNNVLATANLTYNIVTDDGSGTNCGAVNIGTGDQNFGTIWPSGFANTLTGCKVQFSTGYVNNALYDVVGQFTQVVTWTNADPARGGSLAAIRFKLGSQNIFLKDMNFTTNRNLNTLGTNATVTTSGTGVGVFSADSIYVYYTKAIRDTSVLFDIFQLSSGLTGTISNFGCDWCGGAFSPQTGYTYTNFYSRHPASDVVFAGNTNNFSITNGFVLSPTAAPTSPHPDTFQIADGSTPHDYTVSKYMVIQGQGDLETQGPYFGGGPTVATGYIDDGTSGHGAGKVFIQSGTSQFLGSGSQGSVVYSTSGSPLTTADAQQWYQSGSGTASITGTTMTVTAMASGYFFPTQSVAGTGVTGGTTIVSQLSGTPYGAGDYQVSASQTVTSKTLTGSSTTNAVLPNLASNINYGSPGGVVPFYGYSNYNIAFDQIAFSGFSSIGLVSPSDGGTSSYSHYAHVAEVTPGVTDKGPPHTTFGNCNIAGMHTGSYALSKGMEYDFITTRQQVPSSSACSPNNPPANVTVSNVFQANSNTATIAGYYLNGNPKTCLEAKSTAQWDAMTVQQAAVYAGSCLIVKTGSALDLGGGDVANPIGTSATPTWQDGTVVGAAFAGH